MAGDGGDGLVGGVGVEGAVECLALRSVGRGKLDEVLPVGDDTVRPVPVTDSDAGSVSAECPFGAVSSNGIMAIWIMLNEPVRHDSEIKCREVWERETMHVVIVAVGCSPNPEFALYGVHRVEIGLIEVAVGIAVASVGGSGQTYHLGLVGVPSGVGNRDKPVRRVTHNGSVRLDVGVRNIQIEVFRQPCTVLYINICGVRVFRHSSDIL